MSRLNNAEKSITNLVLSSNKFRRWRERIESHGNMILRLDILSVISRRPDTWYVAFIDCLLLTPEGNQITRCVTIRGESVVIIPLLRCIDDDQLYTVMVEQRCISDGALHIGFPAGNDGDGEDFRGMACQELLEETGLHVSPEDLIELSEGITLNSSLSDDIIYFYGFRRDVTREWLDFIANRRGGLHEEGEYIKVKVLTLVDCFNMLTPSTLIGETLVRRVFGISV